MGDQKRTKKTIWVYAVVLFTSAFIVLLLTAYSQIKFNKNIDDYRMQLSNSEKENKSFQMNLNMALNDNIKLKNEMEMLKKEITDNNNTVKNFEKEFENYKAAQEKVITAYETLILAEKYYEKGDVVECAVTLLKKCDINMLQSEAKQRYEELIEKTVKDASYKLYIDGYTKFRNKKYSEAIEKLLLSNEIMPDEYYSDDSLYFASYSYYNSGNREEAKKLSDELREKYPGSSYIKELDIILN